ncbi:MAG: PAS domain-containing protein [Steroidobacteraceae bacterium]
MSNDRQPLSRLELLELATAGGGVGHWTWWLDESFSHFDERCAQLLNLPPDVFGLPDADFWALLHPEDHALMQQDFAVASQGDGGAYKTRYRVRDAAGRWRWLEARAHFFPADKHQHGARCAGILIDLEQQDREEELIREQRLRLDLALSASGLGVFDASTQDGRVTRFFCDERYQDITGLKESIGEDIDKLRAWIAEPSGRSVEVSALLRWIHPDDAPRIMASSLSVINGDAERMRFEGRMVRVDGRLIWIRVEGVCVNRHADGSAARILGTLEDISERAERDLMIRMGEDIAGFGFYEYDIGSNMIHWSPGTYAVFKLDPEKYSPVLGTQRHMYDAPSRDALVSAFELACQTGQGYDLELLGSDAKGDLLWTRNSARVEMVDGRPVKLFGVIRDITRRKLLEAKLMEANRLEQRRLGRELHDGLGQQLTGISLMLEGLRAELGPVEPALADRMARVSSVIQSAIRNTRQLAQVLSPVHEGPEGLIPALRLLIEQVRTAGLEAAMLETDSGCSIRLSPPACSDLYRVAQEAINNALRHAAPSSIVLRLSATDQMVHLEVVDDGVGIDTRSLDKPGFGLLSMHHRVTGLQGKLEIARAEPGTRIKVTVPQSA